ncbi:MAG TPA: hypothetical protein VF339_06510 [Gammaproteobacteria bacterium]
MKFIQFAALALAGCAAAPETIQHPQATAASAVSESGAPASENIEVTAVVELTSRQAPAAEPCRRGMVTGTRIARVQCEQDVPESQRLLDEAMVRSEIDYAREMAMLEEQRRAEEAAALRQMQMQTGGRR